METNIFEGFPTPKFSCAADFMASPTLALDYLKSRWEDAHKLRRELQEKDGDLGYITLGYSLTDPIHINMIGKTDVQVLRFFNLHCAMAYILARFW